MGEETHLRIVLSLVLMLSSFPGAAALPGLDFTFRIWGGDIALRWPIPAGDPRAETELLTFLGGDSESAWFYRMFPDGSLPGKHANTVEPRYTPE